MIKLITSGVHQVHSRRGSYAEMYRKVGDRKDTRLYHGGATMPEI